MSRPPRVLHVAAVEYTARALLAPQMAVLQDRGYDVWVACAPDAADFGADLARFSPVDVRFPRSVRPVEMARAAARLRDVVVRLRPDIVHLHTPAAALPARLVPRRLLPAGTRVVYTVHGFAHVWDRTSLRDLVLERAERLLAPRADALLFQSKEDLEQVRQRGYRTRTVYLGNGVQDGWFTAPRQLDAGGRPTRALFVGRLVREKGVLDLFDAMERAPQVTLRVAGTQLPTERDGVGAELLQRASTTPLQGRVDLLGMLDRQTMQAEHRRTDFLVLPSFREGVPRSIIEGMASGLPAVVTDVRGCRELVRHGYNGLVVPPGEPAALARALQTMATLTDDEYVAMSRAAFETASAQYREAFVYDRLVDAYSQLGVPPPPATGVGAS
jgi:glycosyltransferase involved in cell wall biosynthesis